VNAAGDVIDRRKGHVLAGALTPDGAQFRNTMAHIAGGNLLAGAHSGHGENTTIGVIATNAALTKTEITKVAQMAHDGMARSINPIHTAADGDAIFAAATCTSRVKADTITIGAIAAEAMSDAIEQAVLMAKSIPGYLARCDLRK
jgi:L-aminopeptidase/D-esterase-like protein